MRILFVAMSDSIHTARWINQIADQGWDLHLFPSWNLAVHSDLKNITIHGSKARPENTIPSTESNSVSVEQPISLWKRIVRSRYIKAIIAYLYQAKSGLEKLFGWFFTSPLGDLVSAYRENKRSNELLRVIQQVRPDIIHSMEIQHAGYLTLNAKKKLGDNFPTWIVTNWGADIHYFGEFPKHAEKIRETLEACDYYGCECQRDVILGRGFGFRGEVMPVLTNTGGFDLSFTDRFRQPGPTSLRKVILLKGYQGWVYRALIGLQAIEMCADLIKEHGYRLVIYLPSEGIPEAAMKLQKKTGIPIEIVPYTTHENILKLHGQARVSIGLSMSDAISTSFLEAIVMGSFPIQSCTSCANEWVTSGETAFLVPPEDPQIIADALVRALSDDQLVDRAAEQNRITIEKRLDYKKVKDIVIATYQKIYKQEPLE